TICTSLRNKHMRKVSGFLLGTRQTILETKDDGRTWFPCSIPSAKDKEFNYRLNSVSFRLYTSRLSASRARRW
uniref:Photosynthesis system II assembly factor Ycf48/Hcf136-like domain-containing protein n=1 Tax=Aegilops tauschii subsp. strangulata TaxID=200361 RepID=A0A453CRG1_AEGTS